MRSIHSVSLLIGAIATCCVALPVGAQLVTPRTIPVMQDEQFELYPTSRPGLGVAIYAASALTDAP